MIEKIKKSLNDGDLVFGVISDSRLTEKASVNAITYTDSIMNLDALVHLGNFLNGDNPKKISGRMLDWEIDKYKNLINNKKLFVCQGEKDGWRDERYLGQLSLDMMTDDEWDKHLSYVDKIDGVKRNNKKPYYFVDFPDKNTRLVFLCSYYYQMDTQIEYYQKYVGFDAEQVKWLKNEALNFNGRVILFSHKIPNSRFEKGADPYVYEGRATEPILAILQQAKRNGANVLCWFCGGYDTDCRFDIAGIKIISVEALANGRGKSAQCGNLIVVKEKNIEKYPLEEK